MTLVFHPQITYVALDTEITYYHFYYRKQTLVYLIKLNIELSD